MQYFQSTINKTWQTWTDLAKLQGNVCITKSVVPLYASELEKNGMCKRAKGSYTKQVKLPILPSFILFFRVRKNKEGELSVDFVWQANNQANLFLHENFVMVVSGNISDIKKIVWTQE